MASNIGELNKYTYASNVSIFLGTLAITLVAIGIMAQFNISFQNTPAWKGIALWGSGTILAVAFFTLTYCFHKGFSKAAHDMMLAERKLDEKRPKVVVTPDKTASTRTSLASPPGN